MNEFEGFHFRCGGKSLQVIIATLRWIREIFYLRYLTWITYILNYKEVYLQDTDFYSFSTYNF